MDVKYLNYILAIANRKNMTKAANDLFVSQSSLSQYLSRLEQEIGTPLFFRSKNELTLTPAGELYVKAAEKVVKIQKELYRDIAALNEKGRIQIGATSNFALRMLSEIIPQFRSQYPGISIEISETSLPEFKKMLMEETIDLGIAADTDTAPFGEQAIVLRRERVFFAIPSDHPYTRINSSGVITKDDLIEHFSNANFLLSKKGSSLRTLLDHVFDAQSFLPSTFCETNSISATRSMIAHHAGVSFIAESCSIDHRHITYYEMDPELYRLNLVICRKGWKRSKPENAFLALITSYFDRNTDEPYIAEYDPSAEAN